MTEEMTATRSRWFWNTHGRVGSHHIKDAHALDTVDRCTVMNIPLIRPSIKIIQELLNMVATNLSSHGSRDSIRVRDPISKWTNRSFANRGGETRATLDIADTCRIRNCLLRHPNFNIKVTNRPIFLLVKFDVVLGKSTKGERKDYLVSDDCCKISLLICHW